MQIRVDMCKTPYETWEEVKRNCVGDSEIREDMLRAELMKLKNNHKDSIELFFSKALQIREGLASRGVHFYILNGLQAEFESVR